MNKKKIITMAHVRKAVSIIASEKMPKGIGYRQTNFCGTSCCVLGHAGLIAGRYSTQDMVKGNLKVSDDAANIGHSWRSDPQNDLRRGIGILIMDGESSPDDFQKCFKKHKKKK